MLFSQVDVGSLETHQQVVSVTVTNYLLRRLPFFRKILMDNGF